VDSYPGGGNFAAMMRQMQATAPAPQPQPAPRVIGELTGSVQPDLSGQLSDHARRIADLEAVAHHHPPGEASAGEQAGHFHHPDNPEG
jgi:hypothetical protein